jgi:3-deoxy-D-manno-octulosonate 8-phosphate phosphatase (KDO 8-P phosphatase)
MPKKLFINDRKAEAIKVFEELGGQFITPAEEISRKIKNIKAFVFDWDGVFNDGKKGAEKTSDFSEVDSMGIHIIRYCYWRTHGVLPIVAIITGSDNESAIKFAERDHLTTVFSYYKDKSQALNALKKEYRVTKDQIATVFDDIIDYPLAIDSGLRFLIKRDASPLFKKYFTENKLCDYVTANEQPKHPIREICELIVGLQGMYEDTLTSRFTDKVKYKEFWDLRQSVKTKFYKNEKGL